MANEHLSAQRLEDSTPVSDFSGVKDLPEVRDVVGWLSGKYNSNNDFRDQALDTVVAPRQDIPNWGKSMDEKNLGEAAAKGVFGEDMNKVGEFFYSVKDGFARAIESIPADIMNYAATAVKKVDKNNKTANTILSSVSDARKSDSFEKDLRDFRFGVESHALSNQFGEMLGQMGSIILGGALTKSATVAAGMEGLAEGGQFLQDTIDNESDKVGGIKQWDGSGLGAAAAHGGISAVIGLLGVEPRFLRKAGKFKKRDLIEGVAGEAIEEGLQFVSERGFRRADNAIRNENINEMTAVEELKNLGYNMAMGALGGAVVGGIAVASNRTRASEVVQENFGLNKVEADRVVDEYMSDIADSVVRNTQAVSDVQNPDSTIGKEIRATVEERIPAEDGDTSKQDKLMARAQYILVEQQVIQQQPMVESPALSEDAAIRKPAIEKAVEQAQAEIATLENAEKTARKELEELETKEVSPLREDLHAQEIAEKQAEIDTIREMSGQEPEFNARQNINQESIVELKNKLNSDIMRAAERTSSEPDVAVGAELAKYDDRFNTGKERVSAFSQRLSKETGQEAKKYRQRDTKSADAAADAIVVEDESGALRFLRDFTKENWNGLSKPEILEALYRKHKGNAEELAKLEDFSFIATEFGRGVQAFAEKTVWDARARIRNINRQIEKEAPKKVRERMTSEKESLKKALKIKKEKLPSDKEIERMTRELLGCK